MFKKVCVLSLLIYFIASCVKANCQSTIDFEKILFVSDMFDRAIVSQIDIKSLEVEDLIDKSPYFVVELDISLNGDMIVYVLEGFGDDNFFSLRYI